MVELGPLGPYREPGQTNDIIEVDIGKVEIEIFTINNYSPPSPPSPPSPLRPLRPRFKFELFGKYNFIGPNCKLEIEKFSKDKFLEEIYKTGFYIIKDPTCYTNGDICFEALPFHTIRNINFKERLHIIKIDIKTDAFYLKCKDYWKDQEQQNVRVTMDGKELQLKHHQSRADRKAIQ